MVNDKKTIAVIAVAVVIFLIIGFSAYKNKKGDYSPESGTSGALDAGAPGVSATRQPVPSNISVPDANSANVPADVAKPKIVGPANPGGTASFRSFTVSIKGNAFSPDTVIVKTGDTAHINFTAVDKNYDFTQPDYGLYVSIPKGQTKLVEFSATAEGKFTFYCKVCGGLASGAKGDIIVATK